jgi:hypothetical protein
MPLEVHAAKPSHGRESLFVAVAEPTDSPSSANSGCKPGFQKAMVDESVDCTVEYFRAGGFLTRTS